VGFFVFGESGKGINPGIKIIANQQYFCRKFRNTTVLLILIYSYNLGTFSRSSKARLYWQKLWTHSHKYFLACKQLLISSMKLFLNIEIHRTEPLP